jgi:tRNA/rRNA methyltransferase/tRNA (cytidine32/uridine32-2'-O)-methyltransferase
MRRLFNRAQLDVKEIDILRGVLSATQRKVGVSNKDND